MELYDYRTGGNTYIRYDTDGRTPPKQEPTNLTTNNGWIFVPLPLINNYIFLNR